MTCSNCVTEWGRGLVLDSSVVINILATDHASTILRALPFPIMLTESVVLEIQGGAATGRTDFERLRDVISEGCVAVKALQGAQLEEFFSLVSGSAADSLGDGEAATLAFAQGSRLSAAIDEKKATRIASERYGGLRLVTTVDVLSCEPVQRALGAAALIDATFNALMLARMQVREHQFEWVAGVLGFERVAECPSLRALLRRRTLATSQGAE